MSNVRNRLSQLSVLRRLKDLRKKQQRLTVTEHFRDKEASLKAVKLRESEIETALRKQEQLVTTGMTLNPLLLESQSHHIEMLYDSLQSMTTESLKQQELYRKSVACLAELHSQLELYANTELDLRATISQEKDRKESQDVIKEKPDRRKHRD